MVQSKTVGAKVAAPFCSGDAVCFTPIGGDVTGFTFDKPGEARDLATRITGTRCVRKKRGKEAVETVCLFAHINVAVA